MRRGIPSPAGAAEALARLRNWMRHQGWQPRSYQERCWEAALAGRSGLLHVPTGAGKTYAGWFGPLARLMAAPPRKAGFRVILVTPLRAVTRDVAKALRRPIEELGLDLKVGCRTGDSTSAERRAIDRSPPPILITTPESLCLLLARADAARRFRQVESVIVDEWHELRTSKRGVQLQLALGRMRRHGAGFTTWALSATVPSPHEAAEELLPSGEEAVLIEGGAARETVLRTILPPSGGLPWAGYLGLSMLPSVVDALRPTLEAGHSALVFANTRSHAERWYRGLIESQPDWAGFAALHHGSIERDTRARIEQGLKEGSVRLAVATSSLDLGVDFAPVECVVQLGSPKGIARVVQRAGRAGHRPGARCTLLCVPTHSLQLVEIDAARAALEAGRLEPRQVWRKPLDVLAQHLSTCALGGGFTRQEMLEELRAVHSYRDLEEEELDWVLLLLVEGGGTLKAYPEYCKLKADEGGRYRLPDRRIAQLHRMNIGTIQSGGSVPIRLGRVRLGEIDEGFAARLRPGQNFVFAGRLLAFVRVDQNGVLAKKAKRRTGHTPHWAGIRLPISESLSAEVRGALDRVARGHLASPELRAVAPVLGLQRALSRIPRTGELLVERLETEDGHHLFLYPFEGRLVHEGLAALLALRLARGAPTTFAWSLNDYGIELLSERRVEQIDLGALFGADAVVDDIIESVNLAELARRRFRGIARVAGLVFQNYPGRRRSGRQVQSSASLIYDVLLRYDPDNPLLEQARREVIERSFEASRLQRALARLRAARLVEVPIEAPGPLGFPLMVDRYTATLSTESVLDRVERMTAAWRDLDVDDSADDLDDWPEAG